MKYNVKEHTQGQTIIPQLLVVLLLSLLIMAEYA